MKSIRNMKISLRLSLLVIIAIIINAVIVAFGTLSTDKLIEDIDLSYASITTPLAAVGEAQGHFNATRTGLYALIQDIREDENDENGNRSIYRSDIFNNLTLYESDIRRYKRVLDSYGTNDPYEAEAMDYLMDMLKPLRVNVDKIINLAESGRFDEAANMLDGNFRDVANDISIDLSNLIKILEMQAYKEYEYASYTAAQNRMNSLEFLVIGAFALSFIAYFIVRSVTVPLSETSMILDRIAKGNFDSKVRGEYAGEFAGIRDSVNTMAVGIKSFLNSKLEAERNVNKAMLDIQEVELAKGRAEAANEALISSINYASKIQKNLIPKDTLFKEAFSDYSVIWSPRDIVGGDIYWLKNFDEGTVLCVCDCTGHGTPGALLTMLVVSAFESTVGEHNYRDTADILWSLDSKLVNILNTNDAAIESQKSVLNFNDGCDLAVLYISKDGSVSMSAGNMHVFICDGNEVTQIKGQRLFVGDGKLESPEDVNVTRVPQNPNNKFYVASDGLYDQIGSVHIRPFGYKTFKKVILENHNESQAVISQKVWEAFETYRGDHFRRDDVQLITFKP